MMNVPCVQFASTKATLRFGSGIGSPGGNRRVAIQLAKMRMNNERSLSDRRYCRRGVGATTGRLHGPCRRSDGFNDPRQPVQSPIWWMKYLTSGSFLEKHGGAAGEPPGGGKRALVLRNRASSLLRRRLRRQDGKGLVAGLHGLLRRIVAFVVTLEGSRFT